MVLSVFVEFGFGLVDSRDDVTISANDLLLILLIALVAVNPSTGCEPVTDAG